MDGGKGKGERGNAQKRGAARLKEQPFGEKAGKAPYACRTQERGRDGKEESGEQDPDPSCPSLLSAASGGEAGNGILDPRRAEGEHQGHHGTDELIDPDIFFSEEPGEKDAVKKTGQTADQPCGGQNKSTGDEGIPKLSDQRRRTGGEGIFFTGIQHGVTAKVFLENICGTGG